MERVQVYDTTLRDGGQSPGIALDVEEKLEIAHQLARLGVDAIEAGFPVTRPGDFEAVQRIAREVEGPVIKALARARTRDIDIAWEAVRDAARPRITIYVPTSDLQIEHVLGSSREDVLAITGAAIAHARSLVDDVEFSPMDATRTELEFLAQVVAVAIDEGSTVVSVPDTVGYTMPHEFGEFLSGLADLVPRLASVLLGVHCHNDLGLAVANSLAGVMAGARTVECTINGLGERAGNASLEEFVMLLHTRGEALGLYTDVNTREIVAASRLVSRLTGYAVQPNKAIVGRNAFAHETAISQAAVLRERRTYEIMDATTVGLDGNTIILGRQSGRDALRLALEDLGFTLTAAELSRAFARFKEIADRKRQVTSIDLEVLVMERPAGSRANHE
jgi:2-isopropylmalate synthase